MGSEEGWVTCESWGDEFKKESGKTKPNDDWSDAAFDDLDHIQNSRNVVGDIDRKKSQSTSVSRAVKQVDLIDFNDLEVKTQKNKNEKSGWAVDDEAWMSLESN